MEFLGLPPPGGETNIREDMDTVTAQVFYSIGFCLHMCIYANEIYDDDVLI